MSPVSRGRKRKNNGGKLARQRGPAALPDLFVEPEPCDCPACSVEEFDPASLIDGLIETGAELSRSTDALDAEVTAASLVGPALAGDGFKEAIAAGLVPAIAQRANPGALAMLLALGGVAGQPVGAAAKAAANQLMEAGFERPIWADELAQPVELTDSRRLVDPAGSASILICAFRRARREHGFVVAVDHENCGAASRIMLLESDELAVVLGALRTGGVVPLVEETLEPAELRWQVENALAVREDLDDAGLEVDAFVDPDDDLGDLDELDDYPAMAALLGARMLALPAQAKPRAPHDRTLAGGLAALAALGLTVAEDDPSVPSRRRGRRGRVPTLPAKRARSAQPAPIYQIKVGLRGAKPPIWRRLELSADVSLAKLHRAIQIAFGWDDGHLHVFDTAHGEFGAADSEFGVRSENRVTLEQVAPKEKATLRYLYDFGDDWNHDILVERVLDRDDTASYPRCTGGRRAAPPEDCGGVWGYQCLLEILDDPSHPDHEERLGWLGLDDPDDLDPARFDTDEITRALLRQP